MCPHSPPIDCSAAADVRLSFARWLNIAPSDVAKVEVSADGNDWSDIPGETGVTLDVSALYTATPYFRAKVTTGVACSVYSSPTRVADAVYGASIFFVQ